MNQGMSEMGQEMEKRYVMEENEVPAIERNIEIEHDHSRWNN